MSHVGFLVYLINVLLYTSARSKPAPVNRFDSLYVVRRGSAQECAVWGSR